jgi:hypothetical protein
MRHFPPLPPIAACLAVAVLAAGCAPYQEAPPVMSSRLPPGAPGAAGAPGQLSPQEKQRYDALNAQILRDQDAAALAAQQARAYSYYATPYYGPAYYGPAYYSPPVTIYGGYSSGGWRHSGWGVGGAWGW